MNCLVFLLLTEESDFAGMFLLGLFFRSIFFLIRSLLVFLLLRFRQKFLGRDVYLALFIDLHDLDLDLVTKLQDIFRLVDSLMSDLGDME